MTVAEFLTEWRDGRTYVEAHTSGSTGTPKKICLPKADMESSARATNAFFGITEGSVLGLPLSADYIAGKMMAVRAEVAGCRLVEMPVSNSITIEEPLDLIAVVPSQLESLIAHTSPAMVGAVLIGGAPMTEAQTAAVTGAGFNAWLGYGMTETCSHVALRRVGGDDVFKAMPDVFFSKDSRDCLVVRSDRFTWRELVTNDVVELMSDSTFRWLGRADNVINSGGIKLHPEQLEAEFRRLLPGLPEFFLTHEDDGKWGQHLVMVAEKPPETLAESLRAVITDHRRLPARIIAVDALPRTANGKIKRKL